MYVTADRETLAIDALTCQQKWRVREEGASPALRVNRGAAYLGGRLFRGTGDGDLVVDDAATGTRVWKTHLADPDKGESMPAAPDCVEWNGLHRNRGQRALRRDGARLRGRCRHRDAGLGNLHGADRRAAAPQRGDAEAGPRHVGERARRAGHGRRHVDQLHDRSGSRPAVRACRKSRSRFHDARPARRQPLYELDPRAGRAHRRLSQSLLARARRLSRLGPRRCAGPRDNEIRQTRRRGRAEGRPAPRVRPGEQQEAVRHADHHAAERYDAAVDDAAPLLPGLLGRHRMERACLQPGHEPVLRRNR